MCFTSYKLLSALQPKFIQNEYNIAAGGKKNQLANLIYKIYKENRKTLSKI